MNGETFVFKKESTETTENLSKMMVYGEAVIRYMDEHGEVKPKQIQELLGLRELRAREILSELCKEGIIEKHGSGRGTYYTSK